MTNAQKWVALFLVAFIFLFILAKITRKEEVSGGTNYEVYEEDVVSIMQKQRCFECHGENLQGTGKGPSLYGIQKYWSRAKLINYLRNPKSYASAERFEEYQKKYKEFMPSFEKVDTKNLGKIADYILSLKNSE